MFGDLATIGRRSAVVALDHGIRLTGLVGWWFWGIAHVWYLIGFRSRVVVSFEWLWSYLTRQRGARLITGRRQPEGTGAAAAAAPALPIAQRGRSGEGEPERERGQRGRQQHAARQAQA
jgi:NADH:ubiquinone reductase (H+-translocating)